VGKGGIIVCSVIGNKKCPPSTVTSVLITRVEDIAMEEQCITRIKLHVDQW